MGGNYIKIFELDEGCMKNNKLLTKHEILEQVKSIVFKYLQSRPVTVYLYGSWARGEEKKTSDIDIAILSKQGLPVHIIMEIRDALEESTVPYRVDVVDLSKVDEKIKQKVLEEGVIWKDYSKE